MYLRKRAELSGILFVLVLLIMLAVLAVGFSTNVAAQTSPTPVRIVVLDVPVGGTERLLTELQSVEGLDVRDEAWFYGQVKGRGFREDTILEKESDLRWVMNGSDIDFMLRVELNEDETSYTAHFIEAESGQPRRSIPVDMGESGLSGAGAAFLRLEAERVTGIATVGGTSASSNAVDVLEDDGGLAAADDPEVVRARAAKEKQAIQDRLQRDWLWLRGGFRLIGKDVLVAGDAETYSYASSMMPGFELDVEAYPMSLSNPEMASAGLYINYYHGFDGVQIELDNGDILSLPINHFGIEGGAIYRMDSPLGTTSSLINQQVRFKVGVRYTGSTVAENEFIPEIGMTSIVVGARLVFPVGMPGLAVWTNADIVPIAFAGSQAQLYGASSHSYGFGTELGFLFEFMPGLGAAAGYGFQMIRSAYVGQGELENFSDSLAFELVQGMRLSLVYQY